MWHFSRSVYHSVHHTCYHITKCKPSNMLTPQRNSCHTNLARRREETNLSMSPSPFPTIHLGEDGCVSMAASHPQAKILNGYTCPNGLLACELSSCISTLDYIPTPTKLPQLCHWPAKETKSREQVRNSRPGQRPELKHKRHPGPCTRTLAGWLAGWLAAIAVAV